MRCFEKPTLALVLLAAGFCANAQTATKPSGDEAKPAANESTPAKTAEPGSSAIPDSTRLESIKAPRAPYPLKARELKLQGQVMIGLLISETGDVESTEIVSGEPILAQAAADAFKKWKFKPYIRNGQAVKVHTTMPYNFAFSENVEDQKPEKAADVPSPSPSPGETSQDKAEKNGPSIPQRIRVSQGVSEGLLVHRVMPVYPPDARRSRIQGTVLLQATIGRDGAIHNLRVVSGPPELTQAAVGAVKQWRYRPYMLKGEPVEVETTVSITFHM
ncbi:MAG: energy transducer TonB [Acidobacteriia bacterium]|nr:energy transducer TonB [Terriglobia bacterium]